MSNQRCTRWAQVIHSNFLTDQQIKASLQIVIFSETGQKLPYTGGKKRPNGAGSISEVKQGKKKKFQAYFVVDGKRNSWE